VTVSVISRRPHGAPWPSLTDPPVTIDAQLPGDAVCNRLAGTTQRIHETFAAPIRGSGVRAFASPSRGPDSRVKER
jgi:hypothetical protein